MTHVDMRTVVGTVEFPNPVLTASGTSGYGAELGAYVDLASLGGVVVNPQQRELLAEPLFVAVVRININRPFEEERIVQAVELLLDRGDAALDGFRFLFHTRPELIPGLNDAFLHESHVASCWLQPRQFVYEQSFELPLADVYGTTLGPAVVVRESPIPALRPASG